MGKLLGELVAEVVSGVVDGIKDGREGIARALERSAARVRRKDIVSDETVVKAQASLDYAKAVRDRYQNG